MPSFLSDGVEIAYLDEGAGDPLHPHLDVQHIPVEGQRDRRIGPDLPPLPPVIVRVKHHMPAGGVDLRQPESLRDEVRRPNDQPQPVS